MSNTNQSEVGSLAMSLRFPQTTSYTLGEGPPVFEICTCLSQRDATAVHTLTITLPEDSPLHDELIPVQPDEVMDWELEGAGIAERLNQVQDWVKYGFVINKPVELPSGQISYSWVRHADPETTISVILKRCEETGSGRENEFQYYHRLLMRNIELQKSCNLTLKDLRGDVPATGFEALRAFALTAFLARTVIAGPFGDRRSL